MASQTTRPIHIFLAEDNSADAFLVELALKEHGIPFILSTATDGEAAMQLVEKLCSGHLVPDVMLIDINLPRQEGGDVLKRLRTHPLCQSVPVVVMTSSENRQDRDTAKQFGATFFVKPSDLTGFLQLGPIIDSLCNPVQ